MSWHRLFPFVGEEKGFLGLMATTKLEPDERIEFFQIIELISSRVLFSSSSFAYRAFSPQFLHNFVMDIILMFEFRQVSGGGCGGL